MAPTRRHAHAAASRRRHATPQATTATISATNAAAIQGARHAAQLVSHAETDAIGSATVVQIEAGAAAFSDKAPVNRRVAGVVGCMCAG
jgi:hypothetical protein